MLKRTRFELRRAGQGKRPRPRANGGSIASHPIAPGKVLVSFAPLGRGLSGGLFCALKQARQAWPDLGFVRQGVASGTTGVKYGAAGRAPVQIVGFQHIVRTRKRLVNRDLQSSAT